MYSYLGRMNSAYVDAEMIACWQWNARFVAATTDAMRRARQRTTRTEEKEEELTLWKGGRPDCSLTVLFLHYRCCFHPPWVGAPLAAEERSSLTINGTSPFTYLNIDAMNQSSLSKA